MRAKLSLLCLVVALPLISLAQTANVSSAALTEMRWRDVGPLRGGRTRANCGVPSQPSVFYMAQVNGGVWKTTDYGRTWMPIFDHEPTGSVGAIVVSPSNPNIIYVGSGEGLHRPDLSVGDGIYKSTDAGKTWTHLGLRDGQQIAQMALDPHNPDRLFVAVAGHPYGPNPERGIYRSTDGGKSFDRVLYKDENIGGAAVVIDPSDSKTVYATLWRTPGRHHSGEHRHLAERSQATPSLCRDERSRRALSLARRRNLVAHHHHRLASQRTHRRRRSRRPDGRSQES